MKKIITICLIAFFAVLAKISFAQTQVTFYTTKGVFVVTMEQTKRPITTANFLKLVNQKFYDGIIFHRVVAGFVIQGGDPTGTGSGGSGVTIPDELSPAYSNVQKTIAMAKTSAPNSATSQFYINLVNNTGLDPTYSAFGIVISGFSVVQAIGAVPVDGNDKPLTTVKMDSVRVTLNPTGIDEMNIELLNVNIFPNPVTEESLITIESNSEHAASISIYNQLGMELYREKRDLTVGENYISFQRNQLNSFPEGMYYLVLKDQNSSSQHKFMLVR